MSKHARSPIPLGYFAPFDGIDPFVAAPAPARSTAALPILSAASLAGKKVPPRLFVVPGMVPDRTVTILAGDGGVGKSTLIKQLAVSVSTSGLWLGETTASGPVIDVSAEDDLDEQHRRLAAIAPAMGVELADLKDLHLVPLAGLDAVMGAPEGKSGIIRETDVWRRLVGLVERIEPRLVILDTLADVFAGNEIIRSEARQFVSILRGLAIEYKLAVVLLAHPSLTGISSGSGTSGSTAWSNSVRSRLYLETIKGEDGQEIDPDVRMLHVKKANYGPAGGGIRLRWSDGCFVRVTPAGGFGKLVADARIERVFLDLLGKLSTQGRDVSSKPSQSYAPTIFEKHPNADGIRKREFASAMERLLMAERIFVETSGPPSRRYSKIVLTPLRSS